MKELGVTDLQPKDRDTWGCHPLDRATGRSPVHLHPPQCLLGSIASGPGQGSSHRTQSSLWRERGREGWTVPLED